MHHMIVIYDTHVENDSFSRHFFSFFQNFDFSGCQEGKRGKNGPKWRKILSVALYISGTIDHMTVIYGTHL